MTAAPPLIAFAHVGKSFDGGRVRAVDDVSIEVAEGEFLAIVGGSGSGKTTLLRRAKRRIVLMDEPFGALDPLTRDALGDDYRALHSKLGLSTVMITHDMTEAILLADRIAVMRAGRLLAQGTLTELSDSDDAYVGELLRTPRRQAERLNVLLPRDGAA